MSEPYSSSSAVDPRPILPPYNPTTQPFLVCPNLMLVFAARPVGTGNALRQFRVYRVAAGTLVAHYSPPTYDKSSDFLRQVL
jgi:hypothetical protein